MGASSFLDFVLHPVVSSFKRRPLTVLARTADTAGVSSIVSVVEEEVVEIGGGGFLLMDLVDEDAEGEVVVEGEEGTEGERRGDDDRCCC